MSVRARVMNVVRANPDQGFTQLRIGRIVTYEHKGDLDNKTDEDILALLQPSPEQDRLDERDLGIVKERQENGSR